LGSTGTNVSSGGDGFYTGARAETTLDPFEQFGPPVNWNVLLNQYGKITNGLSQVKLEQENGNEVVGTISVSPLDETILIFNTDSDTIPANTISSVTKIINPLTFDATAAVANGTRFLITDNIGDSTQYWQGLSEKERNIFRFLHVSTDEVHGSLSAHDPPFTESTSYAPRSPYSATKASADHLVRSWHHTYGFPAIVTNCSNNYGPRQFPEKLIPLAILKMLHGQDIPLYGDGRQIRDWLHVTDHCRALQMILQCGDIGGTYLVGSGREISNRELLLKLCEAMDETQPRLDRQSHAVAITHVVDRPGHDQRYAIDSSHIRQTLGWHPQNNLDAGLRDTINWYLNNRGWWRDILSGTYAMQRLGNIP
jgi:dTDP-glucose 4,6-dehydratase